MSLKAPVQKLSPAQENPLARLSNLLAEDMKAVNATILTHMKSDVALIPELASHLIAAGGKRLRPMLTIATAQMCGYKQGNRAHDLSACVEFIHTATLLHDDVVDASDTRRGQDSANEVFGNEAAVLVGDFLFSRAFQIMVADGSLDVLRILSNASAVIAEGEVMQLIATQNLDTSYEKYIDIITSKTAALFAAACETGAVVADSKAETSKALYQYGLNLGIAFQIADDVLDYQSNSDTLGKSIGDDFKEGKMTLPIIYAIENATEAEKTFWHDMIVKGQSHDEGFNRAVELCEKYDVFNRALQTAHEFVERAVQSLDTVPANEIKSILTDIAHYVVERRF